MLPKCFRVSVLNSTGVNQVYASGGRLVVRARFWRIRNNGSIEYSDSTILYALATGQTLNTGAIASSSTINNTKWMGMLVWLDTTTHGSVNGAVAALLEASYDGGTTWLTAGQGQSICSVTHAAAGSINTFGQVTM